MRFIQSILISVFILFALILQAQNYNSYIIKAKDVNQFSVIQNQYSFQGAFKSNYVRAIAGTELEKYFILPKDKISQEMISNMINEGIIEFAEPNYIFKIEEDTPNDTFFNEQWALKNINAQAAWSISTGENVVIGIVDTGIEYSHEDLQGQIKINEPEDLNQNGTFEPWSSDIEYNGVTGDYNGIDDDGNGYIDDVAGYDFVDQETQNINDFHTPDPEAYDEHKHGTAVAGVIAARNNNGKGITGLAYNSKIIPVRAFDVWGDGESDDIAAAIVYLAVNGVDIINMSFGENKNSRFLEDAIAFAESRGCVLVASAGNNNWAYRHYPSDFNEVICVGNSTIENKKSGLSNFGSQVDLFAPGSDIKTCGLGNSYINIGGTSFSAPYVSAAAALLLSKFPHLTPEEVKGIIVSSANDVNGNGWDTELGAGILDVEKMLNFQAVSRIEITSPKNEVQINRIDQAQLDIYAYATHPLFESGEVLFGAGYNPKRWKTAFKFDKQIHNDKICTLNLEDFIDTNYVRYVNTPRVDTVITKDTVYTVALKINLKNNKSLEDRIYTDIFSNDNSLNIIHYEAVNVWDGTERKILITATTSKDSYCYVKYNKVGKNKDYRVDDNIDITTEHKIILEDVEPNVEYEAEIRVYHSVNSEDNEVIKKVRFTLRDDNFTQDNFSIKPDMTIRQRLYMTSTAGNIDGKDIIVTNDFNSLAIGEPIVWSYQDSSFQKSDSLPDGQWILKDIGDTDGDGNTDILAMKPGISMVFEKQQGYSLFDNHEFQSSPLISAWGDQLYDIDNDGLDEIICFNDLDSKEYMSYYVFDYNGSEYKIKDSVIVPKEFRKFKPAVNSCIADFDADGNNELAYCNSYGQLFIYEYHNGFQIEFIDSTLKTSSNNYLTAADTDGDGKKELHFLKIETSELFGKIEGQHPVWSYRIYQPKENNTWKLSRIDHFIGGREDNPYVFKNGMTSGDLTGDGKDEVVLLMMPNIYVFSHDKKTDSLMPLWNYPAALSNNAVIHDFDGNGINEIGFSGFNATVFYEINSENFRPGTPTNLTAEVLSEDSAILSWNAVDNAEYYQIATVEDNQALVFDKKITDTQIEFTKPEEKDKYNFSVLAVNKTFENTTSYFSDLVEVLYHHIIDTVTVKVLGINPIKLELKFNGTLKRNSMKVEGIKIFTDSCDINANSVIVTGDSTAIATFPKKLKGTEYKLSLLPFYDRYNAKSKTIITDFKIEEEEKKEELYLTHLEKQGGILLEIFFSEKVDYATASDSTNYILKPFGMVESVGVSQKDSMSVQLILSTWLNGNQARGVEFTVTAKDILAQSGNMMTDGPGNTLGFVVSAATNAGAYVYPQPISLKEKPLITFAGLTDYAEIQIISMMDGEIIQTLYETDGNGGCQWDCRDKNGNLVSPGIYIYKIKGKNTNGEEKLEETKKFIISP